jgi:hypothetical protein
VLDDLLVQPVDVTAIALPVEADRTEKRVFLGSGGAARPELAGGVLPCGPGIDPLPASGRPLGGTAFVPPAVPGPDAVSTVPLPAAAAAAARAASCSARSRSRCAMARSGRTSSVVSLICGGRSSLGIRRPRYCLDRLVPREKPSRPARDGPHSTPVIERILATPRGRDYAPAVLRGHVVVVDSSCQRGPHLRK